jgi:hypothetical protein
MKAREYGEIVNALCRSEAEIKIKEPRPNAAPHLRLSTVRDHEGAGQLGPRTITNSAQ